MASYDSVFFTPYLKNVYALQFLNQKLQSKQNSMKREIERTKIGTFIPEPLDQRVPPNIWLALLAAILLLACLVKIYILHLVAAACFTVTMALLTALENQEKDVERQCELASCWTLEHQSNVARERIPRMEEDLGRYRREQERLQAVLEEVYGADVIPPEYRDEYAAAFLYRVICDSKSPDWDELLQTLRRYDFSVQDTRRRVEDYIAESGRTLINGCILQAGRQKQESNSMHSALSAPELPAEKRDTYLHVCEATDTAAQFFRTVNYLSAV